MPRLRACAAALAGLVLCAAPLWAQTLPAPAASPAAAPAPAAEPASDTIPVGDISARAQRTGEEVRTLEASLARGEELAALRSDLTRLSERLGPSALEVGRQLAESPGLAGLTELRLEWDGLARQVGQREDRLSKLVNSLEQQAQALKTSRELWTRTLAYERERDTPAPILESARLAAAELTRGIEGVQKALQDTLVVQNEYASLHATVQSTLDSIDDARHSALDNLLVRDDAPLWQLDLVAQVGSAGRGSLRTYLLDVREQGARYLEAHAERIVIQLLCFALLYWALRAAHDALRAREPETGDKESAISGARLATRHPLAAALLLTLLVNPFFHEGLPRSLANLVRLAFMLPAVVVLRPLLGEGQRAPLYLLAGFYTLDRLREMMTGAVTPGRALFTLEMLLLAGVLLALLHRRRLEQFPEALRGKRWLLAVGVWFRISALLAVVAALASVTGYTRLANLIGGGVLGSGYAGLVAFAFVRIAEGLAAALFGGHAASPLRTLAQHRALFLQRTGRVLRAFAVVAWLLTVLNLFGLQEPLFRGVRGVLTAQIGYGSFQVQLSGVLAFALTLVATGLLARAVQFVLDEEVFPRLSLARGVPIALATLARYAILLIGFLVALSALGFNLDRITLLLSAFGVGIGFGLQTVVNNFVSGLILLFERPVKVGDVVELTGVEGTVQRIGIRASTVRTADGADVIVPNALLISGSVVNWTLTDRMRRLVLPIGVAYESDPGEVLRLLLQVASAVDGVCAYPKPVAAFIGFGESTLDFQLRVWTEDLDALIDLRSQLSLAILVAFRAAQIEIPFPQRALHVASVSAEAAQALRTAAAPPARSEPG